MTSHPWKLTFFKETNRKCPSIVLEATVAPGLFSKSPGVCVIITHFKQDC